MNILKAIREVVAIIAMLALIILATINLADGLSIYPTTEEPPQTPLDAVYSFDGDSVMLKIWPEAKISCQWDSEKWSPCFGFDGAWCLRLDGDQVEPRICYPEPK